MQNFNDFINNITDYYTNTYSNTPRPFIKKGDEDYTGSDLEDNILKNYATLNAKVVAGLELVYSFNRAEVLSKNTYNDYYNQYELEAKSKKTAFTTLNSDLTKLLKG